VLDALVQPVLIAVRLFGPMPSMVKVWPTSSVKVKVPTVGLLNTFMLCSTAGDENVKVRELPRLESKKTWPLLSGPKLEDQRQLPVPQSMPRNTPFNSAALETPGLGLSKSAITVPLNTGGGGGGVAGLTVTVALAATVPPVPLAFKV